MDSKNRLPRPVTAWPGAPSRVRKLGRALLNRSPGVVLTRYAQDVEAQLLTYLKSRLDEMSEQSSSAVNGHEGPLPLLEKSIGQHLQELRQRSLVQTEESAREDLLRHAAFQLVPDEVRLLAALSDDVRRPVSHLEATNRMGTQRRRVWGYLSRLGQEAGIVLPRAPEYLRHLDTLGLLVFESEDKKQSNVYERIENALDVRDVFRKLEQESGVTPRFRRERMGLSELGRAIWRAADPMTGEGESS